MICKGTLPVDKFTLVKYLRNTFGYEIEKVSEGLSISQGSVMVIWR